MKTVYGKCRVIPSDARGIENLSGHCYNRALQQDQIDIDIANPSQLTRIRVAKQYIPTSKKYFHDGAEAQSAFAWLLFLHRMRLRAAHRSNCNHVFLR